MLLQFSVANYLSFRERVTLSLVASKDTEHPENTFPLNDKSDLSLLKSVGIYGANASGKSNLINALRFMTDFVRTSASEKQRGDAVEVVPFKLDPKTTSEPSEFEMVFVAGDERYVYGFTADSKEVHEEWLTATRMTAARRKPRLLFERSAGTEIHFGDSWRGDRKKLQKATRPNALFLSVAVQFANPIAEPVFDYFDDSIREISDTPDMTSEKFYTTDRLAHDEAFAEYMQQFMVAADVSIRGLVVETVPLLESGAWTDLPEEIRQDFLAKLSQDQKARMVMVVKSLHRTSEGSEVAFDLDTEESAGTRRLFALAGPWSHVLDEGLLLLVDELDAHLHPLMTRFLLKLVHGSKGTPQLIFTTHDSSVLDAELFRRDQIWFAEKDEFGATKLYSLWDYKSRKDENFEKGYLGGRYGATPIIGGFALAQEEK